MDNILERIVVIENSLRYLSERVLKLEEQIDSLEETSISEIRRIIEELQKLIVELRERILAKEVADSFRNQEAQEAINKYEKLEKELETLKRFAWIALGIFSSLQFLVPLLLQFLK